MKQRSGNTRPVRKRRAAVRTSREEIHEKAMGLFLKKGYHGTSTRDICEALGISRPTLYWYFKDKEDILFSLHKERLEKEVQPLLAQMKEIDDPLTRIRLFIHRQTTIACSSPSTKVLINETPYLAPEHSRWVLDLWSDVVDTLREALHELKEDAKIKDVNELFAAFSLIGMVMWPFTWFDHTRPESIEGLIDTIEGIFLGGLLEPCISLGSQDLGSLAGATPEPPTLTSDENGVTRGDARSPSAKTKRRT